MSEFQQKLASAYTKHEAGDLEGAAQLYQSVLAEAPEQADALHMLGVIAQQKGNPGLALKLTEAALAKQPDMPFAWHNRGLVLRVLGRLDDAIKSVEQAVSLKPDYAEAWDMAGLLWRELKEHERARTCHARAIALRPKDLKFQSHYALLLMACNDLPGAYRVMHDVVRLDSNAIPLTLANILKGAGYPARAIPYFRRTRELLPHNAEVRVNEAAAWLQISDFAHGLELWETRPDLDGRFRQLPLWQGTYVEHLLLHEDQGIGDALQCVRYIPMLHGRAGRITLQVNASLKRLLIANLHDVEITALEDDIPKADARTRLFSLPFWCRTTFENIPAPVPYLHEKAEWRNPWPEKLRYVERPRVGLVWGGNPNNIINERRSVDFAQLGPILEAGGAHLVSLQKGKQKAEMEGRITALFDADPFLDDFATTAGLIAELDLVIAVDTAVAHLAGAMGKPVWLLIPFDPDWRWLLGREDSPWYPAMRLFRQTERNGWPTVIARVAEELRKFLGGDTSVLRPSISGVSSLQQNPNAVTLPDD